MKSIKKRDSYFLWNSINKKSQEDILRKWKGSPGAKQILLNWQEYESPQLLWQNTFPNREFKYGTLRTWISEIKKYLEIYISSIHFNTHEIDRHLIILESIQQKASRVFLKRYLQRMDKILQDSKRRDAKHFRRLYQFYQLKHQIYLQRLGQRKSFVKALIKHQTHASYLEFMELTLQTINDRKISKDKESEADINAHKINEIRSSNYAADNPLLRIYIQFYDLLSGKDVDPDQIMRLVLNQTHLADQATFTNFFLLLLNHMISLTRTEAGPEPFLSICSFLPEGIEKGYFDLNGYLDSTTFLILMRAGALVASEEKLQQWKNNFLSKIQEEELKITSAYADFCIAYSRKSFQELVDRRQFITSHEITPGLFMTFKFWVLESSLFTKEIEVSEKEIKNLDMWLARNKTLQPSVKKLFKEKLKLLRRFFIARNTKREKAFWRKIDQSQLTYSTHYFFNEIRKGL